MTFVASLTLTTIESLIRSISFVHLLKLIIIITDAYTLFSLATCICEIVHPWVLIGAATKGIHYSKLCFLDYL